MDQLQTMTEKDRQVFLEGLRRYQDRGIPILIDGKNADRTMLEHIFDQTDGGFYMGDYILEEVQEQKDPMSSPPETGILRETVTPYQAKSGSSRFCLKEIRFDKVYHV